MLCEGLQSFLIKAIALVFSWEKSDGSLYSGGEKRKTTLRALARDGSTQV